MRPCVCACASVAYSDVKYIVVGRLKCSVQARVPCTTVERRNSRRQVGEDSVQSERSDREMSSSGSGSNVSTFLALKKKSLKCKEKKETVVNM